MHIKYISYGENKALWNICQLAEHYLRQRKLYIMVGLIFSFNFVVECEEKADGGYNCTVYNKEHNDLN